MSYMKFRDASLYHTAPGAWEKGMIQIETILLRQTDGAYLVDSGEVDKKGKPIGIWVPKSISKFENGILHMPEKIAIEKGLL